MNEESQSNSDIEGVDTLDNKTKQIDDMPPEVCIIIDKKCLIEPIFSSNLYSVSRLGKLRNLCSIQIVGSLGSE